MKDEEPGDELLTKDDQKALSLIRQSLGTRGYDNAEREGMSNLSLDTRLTAFANDEHGETEWRNCVECMGLLFTARKTPLCGVCVPIALREAADRIEELEREHAAHGKAVASLVERDFTSGARIAALEEALRDGVRLVNQNATRITGGGDWLQRAYPLIAPKNTAKGEAPNG